MILWKFFSWIDVNENVTDNRQVNTSRAITQRKITRYTEPLNSELIGLQIRNAVAGVFIAWFCDRKDCDVVTRH